MKKKRICCIVLSLMLICCEGLTMTYAEENSHSVMDWFWQHTSGQTDTDEQNVQAETTQEEMVQSEVTQDESVQSEAAQSEMVREETAQNEVVQDKAAQAETEQNETVVLENIGGAQEEDIFSQLPREFETFNNSEYGNGFRIGRNGSFWEDSEERYSSEEGIVHVNQFEGKFTKPEKVSDYVYSMHIESFDMENPAGTEYYKNDEKYIVSEPHGFDKADEFYIFLPGVSVDELPEQFISCCPGEEWDRNISSTLPEGVYGIYNVNAEKGFIGASDDHIWSKYYSCDYQGREIEVRPYFNIASELSLWPEGTGQVIYWKFAWPIDNLTESATCEFEAYDENGSGNYYISLYLSEDMSRISVDITSIDGTDLSYWGGTADGTLSVELGLYGQALPDETVQSEAAQAEAIQDGAAQAETEQNETGELENIGDMQEEDIFSQLPERFESHIEGIDGRYTWGKYLYMNRDGSFWGSDEEFDDSYENIYICNFSGKFSKPEKISDYVYSVKLETFDMEKPVGTEYYEDGRKYTVSEPYGFEGANEFYIFMPGISIDELPEQFIACCEREEWDRSIHSEFPEGVYGIYSPDNGKGFIGATNDTIWNKDYSCQEGAYIDLNTYCNKESALHFTSEDFEKQLHLEFAWTDEDQTEFETYEWYGSGDYHISLQLSEDRLSVYVNVTSYDGTDLSPWGGTSDGTLSVELERSDLL